MKILDFLGEAARSVEDILFVFSLPYGTSLERMLYLTEKRHDQIEKDIAKKADGRIRRNFADFMYRLKKDGLICKGKKRKKKFFILTLKGRQALKDCESKNLPSYKKYSEGENDNIWKIVIFDIPERERRKRNWLRDALRNLNFKMAQKSVWIGRTALPLEFIEDLKKIGIHSYVEIFCITKKGSLRQIN